MFYSKKTESCIFKPCCTVTRDRKGETWVVQGESGHWKGEITIRKRKTGAEQVTAMQKVQAGTVIYLFIYLFYIILHWFVHCNVCLNE